MMKKIMHDLHKYYIRTLFMTKEDEKVVEGCEKWSQLAGWSHVSISAQIAAASRIIRYDDDCHDYEDDGNGDYGSSNKKWYFLKMLKFWDRPTNINPTHQLTTNAALVVDE